MTFSELKDECAEHYFDAVEWLQAVKTLLQSDEPPIHLITELVEGVEANVGKLFGELDSTVMRENATATAAGRQR